jgi:hypothetical protein
MGREGQRVVTRGPAALEKAMYRRPQAIAQGRVRNEAKTP